MAEKLSKQDLALKATPEKEDFAHKYTEEGQGKIGAYLLDGYFRAVHNLLLNSGAISTERCRAVEVGCGEGFSTERLRAMLPSTVDMSASEFVADLVPRAQKRNPDIAVIQESVYELTYDDASVDLVFLLEVLEHLDYPQKALQEIHRVLTSNGVLILGVPREPLWRMLNMARGKYLKDFGNTTGHLNHWSSRGLVQFVEENFGPVEHVERPLPWTIVSARKGYTESAP